MRRILSLITSAACFFLLSWSFSSCNQQISDLPIPPANFPDAVINLNLPEYINLRTDGGLASISQGVRGIILYRKNAATYLAFERNCSYQPSEACATVEPHSSNLFLMDVCCGSNFSLDDGTPTGGPAWRPLRIYKTYLNGTELTVTSESANGM